MKQFGHNEKYLKIIVKKLPNNLISYSYKYHIISVAIC